MYRPPIVTLEVVDLAGQAIAGSVVTEDDEVVEPTAHGQWRLPADSEVVVRAPGFAARRFKVPGNIGPVRLTLLPESVITGRVVDARTGAPVARAVVRVPWLFTGLPRVVSDVDGRYRIGGLGPGRFLVHAEGERHDGQIAVGVGLSQQVEAPPLAVYERSVLAGRLLDGDGAPSPRGFVRLKDSNHSWHSLFQWADKRGEVRMLLPRGHRFAVEFSCEHHVAARPGCIEVDAQDLVGQVWRAARGLAVQGRVIDEGERPVPGALVLALGAGPDCWPAVSGDDGSFFIGGLVGREVELEASVTLDGTTWTGSTMVTLDPEMRDVTVQLGSSIPDSPLGSHEPDRWQVVRADPRGMVVDADGAPVGGAIVAYVETHGPHELWDLSGATAAPGLTRPDGSFEFVVDELREHLLDGKPMLVALRPGGGAAVTEYRAGAPARLQLAPHGTIVARVLDAEGMPARRVGLTLGSYQRLDFFDSDDGTFVQSDLFAGTYDMRVQFGDDEASARLELGAGGTRTVELVLAPRRKP